jgi:hypothetical protein
VCHRRAANPEGPHGKESETRKERFREGLAACAGCPVRPYFLPLPLINAIFEGACNARGGERLLSMGHLAESSLHMFEPAQLRL